MSWFKQFRYWYCFPLEHLDLEPSYFWQMFFVLTFSIYIGIIACLISNENMNKRELKRIEFKKKYHEERGR